MFIGALVDRAREVQRQYSGLLLTRPPNMNGGAKENLNSPLEMDIETGGLSSFDSGLVSPSTLQPTPFASHTQSNLQISTNQHPEEALGPLLPDHLREAFRRYKRDGEAGGTGLEGLSLPLGVKGSGTAKLGGRRLFM